MHLGLLYIENWTKEEHETENELQWEDDWDDEQIDDDFSKQLRYIF